MHYSGGIVTCGGFINNGEIMTFTSS